MIKSMLRGRKDLEALWRLEIEHIDPAWNINFI